MDNQNTNPHQALLDKLKQSKNILVTVSSNPSVDQLAACLGLTLWLNKADKHATAVFSGEVPSTLEFLQPEATLEKNTDSLRDFIISLDKSKADKLRYKVEDTVVKIFITPYRTSLSADDLEYSQGDFNVDMVIALGVSKQQDLDTAITAHGRILHDATVATITASEASELGSINWNDSQASSLSELVVDLGNSVDKAQLDGQIATALLTGVVSETDRFSNDKTTPQTMSVSAQLMSAGANQQLVASKLAEPAPEAPAAEPVQTDATPSSDDGSLEITHEADTTSVAAPEPALEQEQGAAIDDVKATAPDTEPASELPEPAPQESNKFMTEPPSMGGTLTANSVPDDIMLEPSTDPLSQPAEQPLTDQQPLQAAPPDWMPQQPWMGSTDTLAQIEESVHSPHLEASAPQSAPEPNLDAARDEVEQAINAVPEANPAPVEALNAQSIDLTSPAETEPQAPSVPTTGFDPAAYEILNDPDATQPKPLDTPPTDPELAGPVDQPFTLPLPQGLTVPQANPVPPTSANNDPTAPPPVPPPLMPPGFPPAQ